MQRRFSWLALAGLLVSCDNADAPPNIGAALSLTGRVVTTEVPLSPPLKPALAFSPYSTSRGHSDYYVLGRSTGSLTGGFLFDVDEPPPGNAILRLVPGEPDVAIGALTAVSPDHPDHLDWFKDENGREKVCTDEGDCGTPTLTPCGPVSMPSCLGTVTEGKNWGPHGYARDVVVLYLTGDVPAGANLSEFFVGGMALSQGYTLIQYTPIAASEVDMYAECHLRASAAAFETFNRRHSTSYTSEYHLSVDAGIQHHEEWLVEWDGILIQSIVSEGCLPGEAGQVIDGAMDFAWVAN